MIFGFAVDCIYYIDGERENKFMKEKPVVFYNKIESPYPLKIGYPTFVLPINHPSDLVTNTTLVYISKVVSISDFGVFETENTKYVPK